MEITHFSNEENTGCVGIKQVFDLIFFFIQLGNESKCFKLASVYILILLSINKIQRKDSH